MISLIIISHSTKVQQYIDYIHSTVLDFYDFIL